MITDRFITSWDDGRIEDIRLSTLLKKYKIPAIFYIPNTTELSNTEILMLHKDGFIIGGHTVNHPEDMKLLHGGQLTAEILGNKRFLENIIGEEVVDFCYPSGRYNESTIKVLKELDFNSARTAVVLNTEPPSDLYRIATTVHVYPHRKEYDGRSWLEVAKELYEKAMKEEKSYYHLWGHSWEIEKFDLWNELEEFFKYVRK